MQRSPSGVAVVGLFLIVGGCAVTEKTYARGGVVYGEVPGAFRGKWYNYYDRALSYLEGGYLDDGIADLRAALALRAVDQRRARTYGLHFVDYFPNRELGIALLAKGEVDGALAALARSQSQVDSGRAEFYLNEAERLRLVRDGVKDESPPTITVAAETPRFVRSPRLTLRGVLADGQSRVIEARVAGKPVLLPTARAEVAFAEEVTLVPGTNDVVVAATDLFGNPAEAHVAVLLDTDAPVIGLEALVERAGERVVLGTVEDAGALASLAIGGRGVALDGQPTAHAFELPLGAVAVQLRAEDQAGNVADLTLAPAAVEAMFATGTDAAPRLEVSPVPETVLEAEVFVDGSAESRQGIRRLTVAGVDVDGAGRRTVYFRRVLALEPGANTITVSAEDGAGRTTARTLAIRRTLAPLDADEHRLSVVLAPLAPERVAAAEAIAAVEQNLESALVEQRRFYLLDRTRIAALATEWQLVATSLAEDGLDLLKLGTALKSDVTLLGWVKENAAAIEVYARLVDSESGQILVEKDVFHERKSLKNIQGLLYGLALKLRTAIPRLGGTLATKDGTALTIELNETGSLPVGARLLLVAPEGGPAAEVVGQARVEAVDATRVGARLLDGAAPAAARVVVK
ncbi:MAG: hypothetical protein HY903_00060 [Deltaproteobacteria bacterium]|nr:hypothetical protein [Deltaproteobacteria bacterium]